MNGSILGKMFSSFQIIITGFLAVILFGTLMLMLPFASKDGSWTTLMDALFTSASAVCVTGLVVRDTALYWSAFGQAVILVLIQIGGLGIITVTAFIAMVSGRRISLLQRSMLQESLSAHQVGGLVKMTSFIFKVVFITEAAGAAVMLPTFCKEYGAEGIWMSVFHSVSAFCNAGFDLMGTHSGEFGSLTYFAGRAGIVIPVMLLIVTGGIGFLTWHDMAENRFAFRKYKMQTKTILTVTGILIIVPAVLFFFNDFADAPFGKRLLLSLFQAVTPRTAGFNTTDIGEMTGAGRAVTVILMLIGGAPGSTAGGLKVTTIAVLAANAAAVIRRKKSPDLYGRRIEDQTAETASALLMMYLFLSFAAAMAISMIETLPFEKCIFETASAIGTVGLSLGITAGLGNVSRLILIILMFLGRVGGLTLMYAALSVEANVSRYPVEKINVG
ncbi:MAG: Trk family potassium uptake protein [Lachnospiraceae bacterium]|nr:Trk family potassium uptake protein [Lachnospiraceae bacterium]